ncbi:MAG TPA: ParB/RepB/Spo0J family partition protein [Spirochaetota bacterium]|nr:ParB/RepB/Spo0J family partition protein [Spirochaetota bacterium]HPC42624.1 ParB/RepB/Spo0J family partition protein [Spirochaetota bacterium]HQF08456.1 ParB/RepB/Spo0J family partition protein [Spirochaetota bacterium]HQH99094.1 ParB/RepB/Spo0J family partition protein [Spirochaetota bacterium]HQJ72431.1 ParB/RepB/Spo0J family partition protein [Spirochaetota bacterium]
MAKKVLGKGLSAIITSSPTPVDALEKGIVQNAELIVELAVDSVLPNPDQPRTTFDELEIKGLAASIQAVGLLQPIIVRRSGDSYYVVAGERRLRAVKHAGMKKIRAIVIEADEAKNLTLALIENIQRTNLNPIEEAEAYKVLINRFSLKQQDIAAQVGKDRATIANLLRLLQLPAEIQESLSSGDISMGHAKVLLSVSGGRQMELFREILNKSVSVRALEQLVQESEKKQKHGKKKPGKDAHIRKMEEELVSFFGTKVEIKHASGKGKIEISYYSLDDFDRILDLIKK